MPDEEMRLERWPDRLTESQQVFLHESASHAVVHRAAHAQVQDSKIVTLFGLSVVLVGASGVFGGLSAGSPLGVVLIAIAVLATGVSWTFALLAFWPRPLHPAAADPQMLKEDILSGEIEDPRSAAIEALVLASSENYRVLRDKARWLRPLLISVVVQAGVLFALEITARTVAA